MSLTMSKELIKKVFDTAEWKKGGTIYEKWRDLHFYGRWTCVNEALDIHGDEIFLSVGCGYGARLAQYEHITTAIGIDISKRMCKATKENASHSSVIQADMEYLPFKSQSIDIIECVYVLLYAKDKLKAMKEMSRVLKGRGRLVIFDINFLSLRNALRVMNLAIKLITAKNDILNVSRRKKVFGSLSYFGFKNLALEAGFNLDLWYGNFDTPPFPIIDKGVFSKLSSILLDLWKAMGCNKWGKKPIIKYFSDYLIFRFRK